MMEQEKQAAQISAEDELWEREERCRKTIKTVSRAVFMRLVVTSVLIWSAVQNDMGPWVTGMVSVMLLINLVGALPLMKEWKKQRRILKEIIAQDI